MDADDALSFWMHEFLRGRVGLTCEKGLGIFESNMDV